MEESKGEVEMSRDEDSDAGNGVGVNKDSITWGKGWEAVGKDGEREGGGTLDRKGGKKGSVKTREMKYNCVLILFLFRY